MHSNRPTTMGAHRLRMLVLLTLSAHVFIVWSFYRYHNDELMKSGAQHAYIVSGLVKEIEETQKDIQFIEGAQSWETTQYFLLRAQEK